MVVTRREWLVAAGSLSLLACSGSTWTRRRRKAGVEAGLGLAAVDPGDHAALTAATPSLEVKPITLEGLAPQSGHCRRDGVLAADGDLALARRACERDQEVESDLAEGTWLSSATESQNRGRERHLAGDVEGAQRDYVEAILIESEAYEVTDVTAFARINLGLLYYEQGQFEAARDELQWVLEHSSEPALHGAALHNRSLVLLELDEPEAARADAIRAHELLQEAMGPSHGSVGAALDVLGVIEIELSQLDEAIEHLHLAVETRAAALGPEHPATAASYTNLGVALGRRGRWDQALEAHRQALAIDGVVLGPRHATTAADLGHVGAALVELGELEAARVSFDEALGILGPARPQRDPEVDRLRQWLARCDEGR